MNLTEPTTPISVAFPAGRVGTRMFYSITGISKTIFFQRYRWDSSWKGRLDIRVDHAGRLHMDEDGVHALARELIEEDGGRVSHLAGRVLTECDGCRHASPRSVRICPGCGDDLVHA